MILFDVYCKSSYLDHLKNSFLSSLVFYVIKKFFPASREHKEIVAFIKNTFFDSEFLTSYFASDWPDCAIIIINEVLSWYQTTPSGNYAENSLLNLRTELLEAFSTSFYSIINPKVAAQLVQDLHGYHFEIESLEKRLCNKLSNMYISYRTIYLHILFLKFIMALEVTSMF